MRGLVSLCEFAVLVCLLSGDHQDALGQDHSSQIKKILADWKKRQETLPVILIRASGTHILAKGAVAMDPRDFGKKEQPPNPSKEVNCERSELLLLDLKKGRYRAESQDPIYHSKTEKFFPAFSVRIFDGKSTTATYRPRDKNTHPTAGVKDGQAEIAATTKGYLGGATFQIPLFPLFFGLGIVPTSMQYVNPVNLRPLPDDELLTVHGNAVHGQSRCVILRTRLRDHGTFDEIWVDTAKDSAVVRMLFHLDNSPQRQLDIDYKETSKGWLPASWTFRRLHTDDRSRLAESEQMKVDEIVFEPELINDRFEIEPKPGQRIKEFNRPFPQPGQFAPKAPYNVFEIQADGTRLLIESGGGSISESNRALFANQCDAFHFWSPHPGGGANFLFADGNVRFISYSAASIMPALATRAGGEKETLPD